MRAGQKVVHCTTLQKMPKNTIICINYKLFLRRVGKIPRHENFSHKEIKISSYLDYEFCSWIIFNVFKYIPRFH